MGELRSEIQFIKGLRDEDRTAYSMEIQSLKARVDALEGLRRPSLKIDESFASLDQSVTYDLRAGTNLRMGDANNNASDNSR